MEVLPSRNWPPAHRSDSWKGCTCLTHIKRTEYQREVYVNLSCRGALPTDSRRITPMGVVGVLAHALSQKHDSIPTFSCDSNWWSKTEIYKNSSSENEFPLCENLLVKLDCLNAVQPITSIWPNQTHSQTGLLSLAGGEDRLKTNQRYETALEELFNDIFNRSVLVCEEKEKTSCDKESTVVRSVFSFYRSSDFRCWNQNQEREMWPSVKFPLIHCRSDSLQEFTVYKRVRFLLKAPSQQFTADATPWEWAHCFYLQCYHQPWTYTGQSRCHTLWLFSKVIDFVDHHTSQRIVNLFLCEWD